MRDRPEGGLVAMSARETNVGGRMALHHAHGDGPSEPLDSWPARASESASLSAGGFSMKTGRPASSTSLARDACEAGAGDHDDGVQATGRKHLPVVREGTRSAPNQRRIPPRPALVGVADRDEVDRRIAQLDRAPWWRGGHNR